ncbi:hypothetical protein BDR07DRAFT_1373040 [Suillus spraguei]|nr:hypothetical protein BDR07DRAFT_1373040 [Suillus spraguei]
MTKLFDLDSLSTSESIPIPMHIFKGHWHPSLSESPPMVPTDSFLKRPHILLPDDYDADKLGSWTHGDYLIKEAKVYELLKQHPHPNICIYYGCVHDVDHITAICLKPYGWLMNAIWERNPVTITFDSCILIGEEVGLSGKVGTFGWTIESMPTITLPENDIYDLKQISKFMKGKHW